MGGGSGSGSTTTNVTETKTESQKRMIARMLRMYGRDLGKNETFEGERLAPFSDLQTQVLSGAENHADLFSTPQNVGTPLFKETGAATKGLLTGQAGAQNLTGQDVEDYFNATFRDPAMKSLKEDVNPAIDEAFAGPGFHGSARSQERVRAAQDTSDWLGTKRGELNWNTLLRNQTLDEAKAGRSLSALPAAMQYGNVPATNAMNNLQIAASQVQGLGDLFGFGQKEQTQEQAELSMVWEKFIEDNQITDPEVLRVLLSLVGQNTGATQKTSTSPNAWHSEDWGNLFLRFGAGAVTAL
ncbi:MAG TPA: hypothetical protein DIU00_18580 [Phycisphaerales bacterium]|nr:hypothetical protein [Phycisphaerales bacterium]